MWSYEQCVCFNLDRAETNWAEVGQKLLKSAARQDESAAMPSQIPGHQHVDEEGATVDEFVAIVADMRDSTKHLNQAISQKVSRVSQLQRVYYEVAALLPAMALAVAKEDGVVTEYLGDGVLGLFRVDSFLGDDETGKRDRAICASYRAAEDIVVDVRTVVNREIEKRYSLPPVDVGVGMGLGRGAVQRIGLPGETHAKVIGQCVYRATKLSTGRNVVKVDEPMHLAWPTTDGGPVRFRSIGGLDFDAFEVFRSDG